MRIIFIFIYLMSQQSWAFPQANLKIGHSPCSMLWNETVIWGLKIDNKIKWQPVNPMTNFFYLPMHKTYGDLELDIVEADIPHIAQLLAFDGDVNKMKRVLSNFHDSGFKIKAKEILPTFASSSIGKKGLTQTCYDIACQVRDKAFAWERSSFRDYLDKNYSIIGSGHHLQFGDLMLMYAQKMDGTINTLHMAMYMGGDFIYHKLSPDPRAEVEFSTLEALYDYYTAMALSPTPMFQGRQIFVEFLRWDPEKKIISPKSIAKKDLPNLLTLSERGKEFFKEYQTRDGIFWFKRP